MLKKLNNNFFLPNTLKVYFIFIKNINILVIQTPYLTKKYIKIPRFLNFIKLENFLNLQCLKQKILIVSFFCG